MWGNLADQQLVKCNVFNFRLTIMESKLFREFFLSFSRSVRFIWPVERRRRAFFGSVGVVFCWVGWFGGDAMIYKEFRRFLCTLAAMLLLDRYMSVVCSCLMDFMCGSESLQNLHIFFICFFCVCVFLAPSIKTARFRSYRLEHRENRTVFCFLLFAVNAMDAFGKIMHTLI